MSNGTSDKKLKAVPAVSSLLVAGVSGTLLAIWIFLPHLKEFSAVTMKANTAFTLLVAALALWLLKDPQGTAIRRRARIGRALALVVVLVGFVTTLQYLGGKSIGIDELIVTDFPNEESEIYPGRMSPIAALCFVFLGLALLFLDAPPKWQKAYPTPIFLAAVLILSFQAVVGYLYDVSSLYQVGPYIRIAWQTALCFLTLALGILFSRPAFGPIAALTSAEAGGIMARRLLLTVLLVPVGLGWLLLQGQHLGIFGLEQGTAFLIVVLVLLFTTVIALNAKGLNQLGLERKALLERERNARQEAEAQREKMLSLFMRAPAAISIFKGPDHVREFANEESQKLYGTRKVLGVSIREVFKHSPDSEETLQLLDRVYQKGESVSIREHLTRADFTGTGEVEARYSNSYLQPTYDLSGNIDGVITFTLNVTDQVKARHDVEKLLTELRESEERFRTLADNIPQLTWMTDEKGWIFWYNLRWYDYTGTTLEEMQGWGWKKVHHPEHVDRVVEKFSHHIEIGEPWEDTFPLRSKSGEWRWFLSRAEPIRDNQGKVVRWFGSNTDITQQRETQRELQETIRARDEFLSIASHELKTPLTSIRLQTQVVQRSIAKRDPDALAPERVLKLVEQTDKQVVRLVRLVDDMLDIARIRAGKLNIAREHFDLCDSVKDVLERLKPEFAAAGGVEPVLECGDLSYGRWDRIRIEQVVTNLLTNAMRYGKGNHVSIRIEKEDRVARLCVRDHGVGIAKENHERIFNRFERAISANEVSGLGLGLFITKQIVDSHSGKIWVDSELGKGATFFVELPLDADQTDHLSHDL